MYFCINLQSIFPGTAHPSGTHWFTSVFVGFVFAEGLVICVVLCILFLTVPSQGHYGFHSFRLLTDFVCLYNYELWLCLCKIVRSSVILLLPLFFFHCKCIILKFYSKFHRRVICPWCAIVVFAKLRVKM
jgi:hypothetical protein